jgi:hypothetical protein
VLAAVLGALLIPLGSGPGAAQGGAGVPLDATNWSGWLQRHLEQEYSAAPTASALPGTAAWARHLELEYPS